MHDDEVVNNLHVKLPARIRHNQRSSTLRLCSVNSRMCEVDSHRWMTFHRCRLQNRPINSQMPMMLFSTNSSPSSSSSPSPTTTNQQQDGNNNKLTIDDIPDMTGWTVQDVVSTSIELLTQHDVSEPTSSVHHLLSTALQLDWNTGFREIATGLHNDRVLLEDTEITTTTYRSMLYRRLVHQEPIQYIIGQWDFLDYTITIRPPLLCPRPETEELVLKVLEDPATTESPISILDVGCGTGVIGLSLAKQHLDATVDAIDIEPVAIQTSIENAQRILDTSEQQCYRAILSSADTYDPPHKYDIVVSNPPYIPRSDMNTLSVDVVHHESEDALCGGDDGLDVIRTIIDRLPHWLHPGGICWLEVDPSHPPLIEDLLRDHTKNLKDDGDDVNDDNPTSSSIVQFVSSHKDMFGNDRFVKLQLL